MIQALATTSFRRFSGEQEWSPAIAGQLARIRGARVIGIAGRPEKCAFVTDELGFDACVSHLSPTFADDLKAACPAGVDVYFDNVGGAVFDAVLPLFNPGARMTICGLIAHYGDEAGASHFPCPNNASAAAVSASCLVVPSPVASPNPLTETLTVDTGA